MEQIKVWTKQHKNVLEELKKTGATPPNSSTSPWICRSMRIWFWRLTTGWSSMGRTRATGPPDADYPVWVSFQSEATMLPSEGTVILELELDPAIITPVNIEKWGTILNYSYIPKDPQDAKRHRAAPGGVRGQRRQSLHVPVLPGDQAGDCGQLGTAV